MLDFNKPFTIPVTLSFDDYIYMNDDVRIAIGSLWVPEDEMENLRDPYNYHHIRVPSDLIATATVPLPDFVLSFNKFETTIHTDLDDCVVVMNNSIGLMVMKPKENDDGWEMAIPKESLSSDLWELPENKADLNLFAGLLLEIWYGVQIALLHPQLKTVFEHPSKEKVYTRVGTGKDRKRITKYVRKHYITAEDIDMALCVNEHKVFARRTMAWYVIGHWRQYKNGTRKFIKGYWKGPLRETKRNTDGGRIRELVLN